MLGTTQVDCLDFKLKKAHPPMNIPESIIWTVAPFHS
jgi:hypothetical protein